MLVIVGGPSGCGKSTVAEQLSEILGAPFLEGDSLHPPENIRKMATGHPLTDDDRWDWLERIAKSGSVRAIESKEGICVATCSALALRYRDFLREKSSPVNVAVVFINCDEEVLRERLQTRKGHFMKVDMLKSQLETQELPTSAEPRTFVWHNEVDVNKCAQQLLELRKEGSN